MPSVTHDLRPAEIAELGFLSRTGRYADLERRARALTEQHPQSGTAWKALGEAQLRQGQDARPALQRAAELLPEDAEAHSNVGAARRRAGQPEEAVAAYRRALAINPALAIVHGNLGNALRDLGRLEEAEASYRRALEIDADLADVHNNRGNVLHDLGRLQEAVASYRQALRARPGHADAQRNLGSVLMHLGRIEEGEAALSRAIELEGGARSMAAALLFIPYTRGDARFSELENLHARRASLPPAERIALGFAMGTALESVGDYDGAFQAYEEANHLVHDAHPYDEGADEREAAYLAGEFTRATFEAWAAVAPAPPPPRDAPVPIFIVGMPRSGSSLIEQMLASHPAVSGAGELTTLGELAVGARSAYLEASDPVSKLAALRERGRAYLDQVQRLAPGAAYVTDKMPGNYRDLWLVQLALPHAVIIHSRRDPMDTCFSCYALRFTAGHEYSYDQGTLARTHERYRRLMAHWHAALPAGRILDASYEDLVAEPEREVRRMLAHVGLPWDPACLRFHETERTVRTASAAQVRRPLYGSSVGRWRPFAQYLIPMIDIVGSGAAVTEHSVNSSDNI